MDPSHSPAERSSLRSEAHALYGRALASRGSEGPVDVERLESEHPELAGELRSAHESWTLVQEIYAHVAPKRAAGRPGADSMTAVDVDASAPESLPRRMMKQLEGHTAKTSRYEILGEVARGGMGAVLKVWDSDLRRSLAMKVILSGAPGGAATSTPEEEKPLTRFLEEAQVTSQLDHPGVVPVHELGIDEEGRVYFTMRLVRGRDMVKIIELVHAGEEGWNRTRLLQVLLKVCDAVAYAHSKGVLHRDLKPGNIMVGRFGEVYVMDWGLARVLDPAASSKQDEAWKRPSSLAFVNTDRRDLRDESGASVYATLDGDIVGTPAYMPPEQARGQIDALTARSDVYSLGAILYHALAGHMPYGPPGSERNVYDVLRLVQEEPPEPLHERAPEAPPELVAICEKAMERVPGERYASAQALAEELQSFLEGRVVRAFETGALAEIKKWIKRNRGAAAAAIGFVCLTLGALGTVAYVKSRANAELGAKNRELASATAVAIENEQRAVTEKERADQNADVAEERSREAEAARRAAEQSAAELRVQRDARQRVIEFLVGLFESPDPRRARGETVTAKALLDRGAASIRTELGTDPLVGAALMLAMGRAYDSLGLYEDADPLLVGALERRRDRLGDEHPETLEAQNDLALLYRAEGRYAEAEALYVDALEAEERTLGEYDPLTQATRNDLGLLYYYQGRYDEAEELLQEALERRSVDLGEEHEDTLQTLDNLALLYRKQADFDEAERLFAAVLAGRRETLGDDHPDTLGALGNYASVQLLQGRFERAEELYSEALEQKRRVLGEDHPRTLISINDLAYLLLLQGREREAEPLFEDALVRHRRVLGSDHPFTLAVLNNFAALLQGQGRVSEAEPLLVEALAGSRRVHGDDHATTVSILNGLASVYLAQGLSTRAEELYTEALEVNRRVLAPDHPNTLVNMENLVTLKRDDGDLEGAEELAREMLSLTPRDAPEFRARTRLLEELRAALSSETASD